jgi:hypothetical protein
MPFIHIKSLPISDDNDAIVFINARYAAAGMVMDAGEIVRW